MANEPKVRPSFTQAEMKLISEACEHKLKSHIQAGDFKNPDLLKLDAISKYANTFVNTQESMSALFAKFLASQIGNSGQESASLDHTLTPEMKQQLAEFVSPNTEIVPMELTDEQRYDLLKLKPANQYSEDDKTFFLNKGTMIEFARRAKTNINEGDL